LRGGGFGFRRTPAGRGGGEGLVPKTGAVTPVYFREADGTLIEISNYD
jgi:hypothetical protein